MKPVDFAKRDEEQTLAIPAGLCEGHYRAISWWSRWGAGELGLHSERTAHDGSRLLYQG
jgi:hypothetical protein